MSNRLEDKIKDLLVQALSDHATKVKCRCGDTWYPGIYHNRGHLPTIIAKPIFTTCGVWLISHDQPGDYSLILYASPVREPIPLNLG